MKFKELENIILADGWKFKNSVGSHQHYIHPFKQGKTAIPKHKGDIPKTIVKSVMKQAQLK